jgi:RpiB/LacA/LacB family sugar-phosphate isomerase
MKIAIGSDHAGYDLKEYLKKYLSSQSHEIIDTGTHSNERADYPDYAIKVAEKILTNETEKGILICGSVVGMSIAANKIKGIRAGLCHDTYSAHQSVEHDNINILCLGSRIIGTELAKEIVINFINAKFTGEERHRKRLQKISNIEEGK